MSKIIAYDLETTRVEKGTPELLYITAYGDDNFRLSMRIDGKKKDKYKLFCDILEQHFLIEENNNAQFIAWNGNKYDGYFVAISLLQSDKWILQPYMTAGKALRGIRVKQKRTPEIPKRQKLLSFEFIDGMAMTGITAPLKKFLKTFAPDYQKLEAPNFEGNENFDVNNKDHIKYAERDSEGLYHAMKKVEVIIHDLTGFELKPTVGNLAIRYFMDNIPQGVELKRPTGRVLEHLHGPLKRGGYCWAAQQYHGPAWKYDINQAYAAAMRDAELPCGEVTHTNIYEKDKPGIYSVVISNKKETKVPFYYKVDNIGKFTTGKKAKCWITTIEIEHLKATGWDVEVITGYCWQNSFNMKSLVDKLEVLRSTDKDGPSGPLGTMVKALGNNAYGKTLEQIWGNDFVFAKERPEGYDLYDSFDPDAKYIFARQRQTFPKKYHLPQIGIFITAHVRCVVRNAALQAESDFLYADTDCVAFKKEVKHLVIHKTKYGAWKAESAGDEYIIIGKKAYWSSDGSTKAKGLIVKGLKKDDYLGWRSGKIPVQVQTQRQNILKFLGGESMFKEMERRGTNVDKLKNVKVIHGYFIPA